MLAGIVKYGSKVQDSIGFKNISQSLESLKVGHPRYCPVILPLDNFFLPMIHLLWLSVAF